MVWQQIYDPLGNMFLSTLLAAVTVVVMLVGLGFLHMKAHIATALGIPATKVGVKATTNETMGFVGRQEGIAAMAVASVDLPETEE